MNNPAGNLKLYNNDMKAMDERNEITVTVLRTRVAFRSREKEAVS